ncbi:CU044_5270 family protein [Allokutzneria sp. NRRL B-24872]|uniref:CU044_5270 family protein n=1 Tax=Allokutzneria sp. NRRL B-24872 TaxID=1137961 RepID=UPI001177EFDF|nr:CU044_5270 family protein [Allokutzneria sp. NRRL B-24872]
MWTDTELDDALTALHKEVKPPSVDVRAALMVACNEAKPRRRYAWTAAAVAAVTVGVLAMPGAPTAAAGALGAAAAQVLANPEPLPGPGQFFYTATRESGLASSMTSTGKPLSVLQESMTQLWVPSDRSAEWTVRSGPTGARKWLAGNEDLARREGDGGLLDPRANRERVQRGPCGDFPDQHELGGTPDDGKPCGERYGHWEAPTPRFLADLPRDPDALYERLSKDAKGRGADVLRLAAGVLRAAETSAELRAAVYRALVKLPGLDVTDNTANLDGRKGTALGLTENNLRDEVIVDTVSGRYIGRRSVLVQPGTGYWAGLHPGTVVEFTAVTLGVASNADTPPAN